MSKLMTEAELLKLEPGAKFSTSAGGEYTVRAKPKSGPGGVVIVPTTSPRIGGNPDGMIDLYVDPVDAMFTPQEMKRSDGGTMESKPVYATLIPTEA